MVFWLFCDGAGVMSTPRLLKEMKNKAIEIILFLWQLPQNILALLLIGIYSLLWGRVESGDYKGVNYIYFQRWRCGVSLGHYVLLGDYSLERPDVLAHEYGHSRQSLILGPLYLLLIGLPSITGNIIDRLFHNERHGWSYEKAYWWYYNQPWEKWADKLGNVERTF